MSSVYFDPALGGDGSTVTDDSNATTGLANGGHRTRFVPALAQVVVMAGTAVTKASEASTSASDANTAKLAAQAAQTGAEAALDQLDDRYLGAKATDPTLDNDGNALAEGAFYWNTTSKKQRVYNGTVWVDNSFVPTAASGVSFSPTGGVAAVTVQDAIAELDAEKARLDGGTHTGTHDFTGAALKVATAALNDNDDSAASTAFVIAQIAAAPKPVGSDLYLFSAGVI
jgi:hypothetical protein